VRASKRDVIADNRVFLWIALATAAVLLIPLVAMRFTEEVEWTLSDFAVIGTLLLGTGFSFVLAARRIDSRRGRALVAVVLTLALLYVWAELAVGVFTTWGS